MSNIVRSSTKVQGLWNHNITDQDFIDELEKAYYAFLASNYGPNNGFTLIQNSAGCDFLTSSSSTILQQLPFFHPCFKFINALVNAQSKVHGVHALYVGALCSGLLFRSLKLEEVVARRVVKDVSDWIQHSFIEKLDAEMQRISGKIDIGNLNQLLCIVRGIIHSKASHALFLSLAESEHIAVKIVEAFLKTIPDSNQSDFGMVTVSTLEGPSAMHSCIRDGLLYRVSDSSVEELQLRLQALPRDNLKLVIFTIPLSPDTREKSLIEWHSNLPLGSSFVDHLFKSLRHTLKEKGVHIIASQKFIDAALIYDLERDGFLVLERLGTSSTDSLIAMTDCCPLTSLAQTQLPLDGHIGVISALEATDIRGKAYLSIHVAKAHQDVTLVLTGINCHVVDFLKESVNTSINLLQRMMRDSRAVVGAGCLEAFAAVVVARLKSDSSRALSQTLDASPSKVDMVFDAYIEAFMRLSVIPSGGKSSKLLDYCVDATRHHLWRRSEGPSGGDALPREDPSNLGSGVGAGGRCACNCLSSRELSSSRLIPLLTLTKDSSESVGGGDASAGLDSVEAWPVDCILDYFPAKMNAIRLAFDGVSELLRIGRCIFDK